MSSKIDEVLEEEIRSLTDQGFRAGFVADLRVDDIFAGPRIFSFDPPRQLFVVERILRENHSYIEEDDSFVEHTVISMIVTDENQLERHLSYGSTHEIYIYKGVLNG